MTLTILLSMLICKNTLFNWNMENHPGKHYNHNTIWLWSWLINQKLQLVTVLPKGQEGRHRWGIARSSWGNWYCLMVLWQCTTSLGQCYDRFDLKPQQIVVGQGIFVKASQRPYAITPRKCGIVPSQHIAWLGSKFFGTFTRIVVKVYNLCRVKTNRLVVLTVKSGLDPHRINKLKDGYKSLSGYFLWPC